jgi:hypothetical protein
MKKVLFALGGFLFSTVMTHAQLRVNSEGPPLLETQSAQVSSALVEPGVPSAIKNLPDAPLPKPILPVQPVVNPNPCPLGTGKPCALLGGRAFFPDPFRMTEHDKSWAHAMKNPFLLAGIGANAAAAVWDYKTTRHCIDTHRGTEVNPIMGQSQAQELSVGFGLTGLMYFLSGKLKEEGRGNYAFLVLWANTSLHFYAAAHNRSVCS